MVVSESFGTWLTRPYMNCTPPLPILLPFQPHLLVFSPSFTLCQPQRRPCFSRTCQTGSYLGTFACAVLPIVMPSPQITVWFTPLLPSLSSLLRTCLHDYLIQASITPWPFFFFLPTSCLSFEHLHISKS